MRCGGRGQVEDGGHLAGGCGGHSEVADGDSAAHDLTVGT